MGLSTARNPDGSFNKDFIDILRDAAHNVGFLQVINYGASQCQTQELLDSAAGFFSLPLAALSFALGLPEDYFEEPFAGTPAWMSKLVHYVGGQVPEADTQGVGSHADCGFVTLLLQDSVGGLQVQPHGHHPPCHSSPAWGGQVLGPLLLPHALLLRRQCTEGLCPCAPGNCQTPLPRAGR